MDATATPTPNALDRATQLAVAIRMGAAQAHPAHPPLCVTTLGEGGGDAPGGDMDDVAPDIALPALCRHIQERLSEGALTLPLTVNAHAAGRFVISAPPADGRLAGRIAIVTGGAQGFGRGIAAELARAGALLTIADLNEAQALRDRLPHRRNRSGFAGRLCQGHRAGLRGCGSLHFQRGRAQGRRD